MQKTISRVFLIGCFVWGIVLWADTWTVSVSTPIDGQVFNQASAEVQSIEVKFCENDAKTKQYTITPGIRQDICIEVINSIDKDILVSMDFVDGTLTNDQWKNRACMDSQKEKFGQYITGNESSFVLPARGSIIKHAQLLYPKGATGNIMGCLVYYTKGVSLWWTVDLNILVRRAKFIDITLVQPILLRYQREIIFIGIILLFLILWIFWRKIYMYKKHKK